MLQYRRDIDGLRAVAVLGVLLFHAFPKALPGGFIGVDVFFVISGFLITGVLKGQCEQGRFSLLTFYERRVRRIIPALAFMLAAVTVVAGLFLPPADLRAYGASLVSVALFGSNVYFWLKGGYFDGPAHEKPLLHTWSLSVEEQFYILWPLAIFALYATPLRRRPGWAIGLFTVAAFVIAEIMVRRDAVGAFFLLPSRAWELSIGAWLAVIGAGPKLSKPWREGLSLGGLALVLAGMVLMSETVRFPGAWALVPCVGTALMIHANQSGDTLSARLLSLRPVVAVGLISYSLYLWHWPALVLPPLLLARDLNVVEVLAAVAAAFALAWLSWRYVELPFRKPVVMDRRLKPVLASGAVLLAACGCGAAIHVSHGAPQRAPSGVLQAEAAANTVNPLRDRCHVLTGDERPPPLKACTLGPGSARVLIWGDSHADHLTEGVAALARARGLAVRQATKSSCRPLLSGEASPFANAECLRFNAAVLKEARERGGLTQVVLAARWTSMLGDNGGPEAASAALSRTIAQIHRDLGQGVQIVVIGATPEFDFQPSKCLARARFMRGDTAHCEVAAATNYQQAQRVDRLLSDIAARQPGTAALLPWSRFCDGATCRTTGGKAIFYRDDDHLSVAGAARAIAGLDHLLLARPPYKAGSSKAEIPGSTVHAASPVRRDLSPLGGEHA